MLRSLICELSRLTAYTDTAKHSVPAFTVYNTHVCEPEASSAVFLACSGPYTSCNDRTFDCLGATPDSFTPPLLLIACKQHAGSLQPPKEENFHPDSGLLQSPQAGGGAGGTPRGRAVCFYALSLVTRWALFPFAQQANRDAPDTVRPERNGPALRPLPRPSVSERHLELGARHVRAPGPPLPRLPPSPRHENQPAARSQRQPAPRPQREAPRRRRCCVRRVVQAEVSPSSFPAREQSVHHARLIVPEHRASPSLGTQGFQQHFSLRGGLIVQNPTPFHSSLLT
nr:uncharacterized protein LOC125633532 [Caretta caretta]